jgi:serine/threonine protein kinase/Tfp pilus assembly protein PilF
VTPQQWQRLKTLYAAAENCAIHEQAALLDQVEAEDPAMCAQLRALLAERTQTDDFPEQPVAQNGDPATTGNSLSHTMPSPASTGDLLEAGKLLAGRFRIIRFIASGGMGAVYEAEDMELGERVALKTIHTEMAANPRMLLRFKKEIQLAKRISHPNVCRIHDLGIDESTSESLAFLTMELILGETLAQHLHANRLTIDEVENIAMQVAAGLSAAHKAGVVHRDLKSRNVILSEEGSQFRAVITDFGTAHATTSERDSPTLTKTGEILGTPDYMAPEQLQGEPTSPATDIYSLGIMLFEMVTGRHPFMADTPIGAALKRLQEPPPSPRLYVPQVPSRWERAILRCLQRDPAARFQSAGDLVKFLETERLPARNTARPALKRPRAFFAIVAVASLLIALTAWILWERHAVLPRTGEPAAGHTSSAPDIARIHYEKGRFFWDQRTQDSFLKATEEYRKAIEADPNYAPAYSGLAWVVAMQSGFKEPKLVFPEARTYANQAIKLNDKLPLAHAALAFVNFYYDWDWGKAESEFKKAIELDPGYASAHSNYAILLLVRNRFNEARAQAELAEKADPVSAAVATGLGRIYFWSGHYREAIEQFQDVLSMHPQFMEAHLSLASAMAATGNLDAATRQISYVLSQSDTLDSSALANLGYMYTKTNERQLARAMLVRLENLRSQKKRYVSPCYPAIVHAALGERDQAFRLLNEGLIERTFEMVYLNINPEYATLRADHRWQKLTRSIGLVQ